MTSNNNQLQPEYIHERIVHMLSIYPKISPTMLSVTMGPQIPASKWRPVYNEMVDDGTLTVETITSEAPTGRAMRYTIIELAQANKE